MKRYLFLFTLVMISAFAVNAQVVRPPIPRESQKMMIAQTVGTTEIAITYSRPAVKGRPIFGAPPEAMASRAKGEATLDNSNDRKAGEPIVPFDHVWRAGANEATMFTVNDDVLVNGAQGAGRLPGNTHFTFRGCEGDSLLMLLDANGIECSTGSACTAGVARTSHVLLAMGADPELSRGSLRLSLGHTSTEGDVEAALRVLPAAVDRARQAALASSSFEGVR